MKDTSLMHVFSRLKAKNNLIGDAEITSNRSSKFIQVYSAFIKEKAQVIEAVHYHIQHLGELDNSNISIL